MEMSEVCESKRYESKPKCPDLPATARKLISLEQMAMGIRQENFWQPVTGR